MNTTNKGLDRLVRAGMLTSDIAGFCGVAEDTVKGWLKGNTISGTRLLAVLMILRHHNIGCQQSLDTLSPSLIKTGELLVLGLTSTEELMKELDIAFVQGLIATLGGRRGISQKRQDGFDAFVALRQESLDAAILHKDILKPIPGMEMEVSVAVAVPEQPLTMFTPLQKQEVIQRFCGVSALIVKDAKDLASDSFTADDRRTLREELDRKGIDIYALSDYFNQLLGENCREESLKGLSSHE